MRAGRSVGSLERRMVSEGMDPLARDRTRTEQRAVRRYEKREAGKGDAGVEKGQSSVYIFKAKQLNGHLGRALLTGSVYSRPQSAAPCRLPVNLSQHCYCPNAATGKEKERRRAVAPRRTEIDTPPRSVVTNAIKHLTTSCTERNL